MSPLLGPSLKWWRLTWPREVEHEAVVAVLRHLAAARTVPLLLRVEAHSGQVAHLVGAPDERAVRLLAHHLPGLRYEPGTPVESAADLVLRLSYNTRQRPLATNEAPVVANGVLHALSRLGQSELLIMEWALLSTVAPDAVPTIPSDGELRRATRSKRADWGWRAVGRIGVTAASTSRRYQLVGDLLGALRAADGPSVRLHARRSRPGSMGQATVLTPRPVAVSVKELTAVAGWPLGDTADVPVKHAPSRLLPAATTMPAYSDSLLIRAVGVGWRENSPRSLILTPTDGLHSTHVIGPTGAGKSTLLLHLILSDMHAGRSALVLDPKGDLVTDVLARVPAHRLDDVVVVDASDQRPVGLNPLAGAGDPDVAADALVGSLHDLFRQHWGPRTAETLGTALITVARTPGGSLAQVPLLLTNSAYRTRVTAPVKQDDPLGVGGFWDWYDSLSEPERINVSGAPLNRMRQLLMRPALRAVLGQAKPKFNFGELFTSRKVVLVNLGAGSLGPEGAGLLGTLIWSHVWQLAQERVQVPAERRHPVTVYADEFQQFIRSGTSFADVLVRCRGLGLGLVAAHQHLGQLSKDVAEALMQNAGSRIAFGLHAGDARVMASLGRGLTPEDISGLSTYEMYANLRFNNSATGWMSGRSLPPPPATTDPAIVVARSRERYGIDRGETERALLVLVQGDNPTGVGSAIGVKRRRRADGGGS